MGQDVTRDLVGRNAHDPFTSTVSRAAQSLTDRDTTALRANNASRNHVLADSRIRTILEGIATGEKANLLKENGRERNAVKRFFTALSGGDAGERLFAAYVESIGASRLDRMNILHDVAAGRENLRIGLSDINTAVSNEFDPVVVDRRLDPRSMEIRDAVISLGHAGLIEATTMLEALAVTKDRFTHEDVTSTVMERRSINERTGSRTVIDPFAAASRTSDRPRSRSIDFGQSSELHQIRAPAREFHYTSRPGGPSIE